MLLEVVDGVGVDGRISVGWGRSSGSMALVFWVARSKSSMSFLSDVSEAPAMV